MYVEDRGIRTSGPLDCIFHLEGVAWWDAPPPRRWHRCWPQTKALLGISYIERCACGAIRMDRDGPWFDRNRKKGKRAGRRPKSLPKRDAGRSWLLASLLRLAALAGGVFIAGAVLGYVACVLLAVPLEVASMVTVLGGFAIGGLLSPWVFAPYWDRR